MKFARPKERHQVFLPSGDKLECTVCRVDEFIAMPGSISSRALEFFGFAFASPRTAVVVCTNCGYGHWFLGPVAKDQLRRRGPRRSRPEP